MLLRHDSIFSESSFLFFNKIITIFLGAILWVYATFTLSIIQIGELSIFIAGSLLLGNISVFGINTTIIRYFPELPNLKEQKRFILISFTFPIIISFIITPFFWTLSKFNLIFHNFHLVLFLVFVIVHSLSVIFDALNIAQRTVKFIFFRNFTISSFKIIGLVAFSYFVNITISLFLLVSLLPQVIFFILFVIYDYFKNTYARIVLTQYANPNFKISFRRALKFSIIAYFSGFFISSPIDFLPIIAGKMLGSSSSAFINLGWIIGSISIFLVSYSMSILLARKEHHDNFNFHLNLMITLFGTLLLGLILYKLIAKSVVITILGLTYLPIVEVGFYFVLSSFPALILFYGITRLRIDNIEEYSLIPAIFICSINLILPIIINPSSAEGYSIIFLFSYFVSGVIVVLIYYLKQSNT